MKLINNKETQMVAGAGSLLTLYLMGSVGYLGVFVAQFKPVMDYTGYFHLINKELTPNPWIPVLGIMLGYAIGEGVQQFQEELKNTNATLPQS